MTDDDQDDAVVQLLDTAWHACKIALALAAVAVAILLA